MNTYGQRQYQHTQITTVDRGRLIVLLYEGAIKFLRQARDCSETGDLEGKSNNINKALDIINELNQSLNMTEGGELAQNLRRLYLFMSDYLLKGKIKRDPHYIDDVLRMLTNLNGAWNEVVSRPEAQEAIQKNEKNNVRSQITV